jgi:hypothetical protein
MLLDKGVGIADPIGGEFMLHDKLLPKRRGENSRLTTITLVDGIAHARQRMGDAAPGLLRLFAAILFS